ncbi:ras guanine nucleotide exchange factor domain-containing protein [Mycena galopus ATCC 62051]|nr:ras guanine nucleotide exchange factor domain-containing protein [Mycena galopus ATCC 62051]
MYSASRLQIDTSVVALPGPSSGKRRPFANTLTVSSATSSTRSRLRSASNASTSSSISVMSPASGSTNVSASASTSSLVPSSSTVLSRPASPAASVFDETVRITPEYVLAMHDYAPQNQSATCLSFRAGQVIHVLNRDSSGWWDGELEGRRGWFPSNYVNVDVNALMDEEDPASSPTRVRGHVASSSTSSTTSWVTSPSLSNHTRRPSLSEALGSDIDSYCPPIMSAVRANRVSHFQPSTACIISCVRSVLSATDTLVPQERRRILSVLASLVAQAKKASDETPDEDNQEAQVDAMVRLGGQVFASVRRFLAVAVQCGVELPERRQSVASIAGSTDTEGHSWSHGDSFEARSVSYGHGASGAYGLDGFPGRNTPQRKVVLANQGSALRARSMVDLRRASRQSIEDDLDAAVPLLPNGISIPAKTKQEQYLVRERVLRHKAGMHSASSTSSSSSSYSSSLESTSTPARPSFPVGPSTTAQVMDALRSTHDQYLSTIAAFIGHAHSHSRTSHASSTGHMYELVREIVEMVCKLLTIVDAVLQHPDVPTNKLGNLQAAKDGLYNVTSTLAESVRLLTVTVNPSMSEDEEKQTLLRSATGALKAGADCVAAVKMCLNRSLNERPFVLHLPNAGERMSFTPSKFARPGLARSNSMGALNNYTFSNVMEEDEEVTERVGIPIGRIVAEASSGSESSGLSKSSSMQSQDTDVTSPDSSLPYLTIAQTPIDPDLPSPTSYVGTEDDGTTWEGSRAHAMEESLEAKIFHGELPSVPVEALEPIPEFPQDPVAWMLSHDYSLEDVAYNGEGHLVGATMDVLVEKMTPHDSIVDPAFSAVFFLTFRLFSSPLELVDTVIARYNLLPPAGISSEDVQLWQQRKGIPVRLRVSNFIKIWVEIYWQPGRIQDLIELRRRTASNSKGVISPKSERTRDPGMSINPPSAAIPMGEIPRPLMTKALLANLRGKHFAAIAVTDFDALELARQLTIMECNLYCAIQPVEVLETGQEGAKPPTNVKAVSSLSTAITGWVAESILSEPDTKKRTQLVKFFIKVADRCTSLHNYSTPRSMLAALDSSTISRLHQTWLPTIHEIPRIPFKTPQHCSPAVPFLGLYLTDVTFCREGNPSHRASPMNPNKKLLNFNKYHKLARIICNDSRCLINYGYTEVQLYLNGAFEKTRHHGDLQDLYRRSLLVEPRQAADNTAAADMRQLFSWATRTQATTSS